MNIDTCSNALIYDAINKGAALVCEGLVESALMHTTLLGNITLEIRSYPNEEFGPSNGIACLRGDEEAMASVNGDEYGLSTTLFSRDTARALSIAANIQSGICHIDAHAVHDAARMPFCGVENSGVGRFGCKAGIAEFTLTCSRSPSRRQCASTHTNCHSLDSARPNSIGLPFHARPLKATTRTLFRRKENLFLQAVSVLPPIH